MFIVYFVVNQSEAGMCDARDETMDTMQTTQ